MSIRPQSTAATDGASVEPQQMLQVLSAERAPHGAVDRLPASAAPRACTSSPDPHAYAELRSLSDKSEATVHTHGAGMATTTSKASAGNVVRLVALPNYKNRPLVHMECAFRQPDAQECLLHREDDSQEMSTMGDVLREYGGRIESIQFDATSLPGPTSDTGFIAARATLPFPPLPVAAAESASGARASPWSMPFLSSLQDITITASRTVSLRSLLELLHYCPMLRRLAVHSTREHSYVLPEDIDFVSEPGLPHLEELTTDGLPPSAVEDLLDKLCHSLKPSMKVEAHFYQRSFPPLRHGPGLQKLLIPIRHANLFYASLPDSKSNDNSNNTTQAQSGGELEQVEPEPEPAPGIPCTFSFSDPAARVQLNWHWTPPHRDDLPNLSHIGLASASLQNVRSVSLTLSNVDPSSVDLLMVMGSFRALRRVEVLATHTGLTRNAPGAHPAPPPALVTTPTPEVLVHPAPVPADPTLVQPVTGALAPVPEPAPSGFASRYRLFEVGRGTRAVLRPLSARVPLLFALAVERRCNRGSNGGGPPSRPPTPMSAEEAALLPHHLLMRFFYEPLWALVVRTPRRWTSQ